MGVQQALLGPCSRIAPLLILFKQGSPCREEVSGSLPLWPGVHIHNGGSLGPGWPPGQPSWARHGCCRPPRLPPPMVPETPDRQPQITAAEMRASPDNPRAWSKGTLAPFPSHSSGPEKWVGTTPPLRCAHVPPFPSLGWGLCHPTHPLTQGTKRDPHFQPPWHGSTVGSQRRLHPRVLALRRVGWADRCEGLLSSFSAVRVTPRGP